MDAKDVQIAKLRGVLSAAPRPRSKAGAEWMVTYMDWFFQMRISVLNETDGVVTSSTEDGKSK